MKNFIFNILNPLSEPFFYIKGILVFIIGPLNIQLSYLFLAVGIDLILGIQVSRKNNEFKWSILFSKVRKKLTAYILWIAMFHAFDMIAGLPNSARWAVIMSLAGLEIISATKNTAKLGHDRLADVIESVYLALTKTSVKPPTKQSDEIIEVDVKARTIEGGTANEQQNANRTE